jgi:hypothetical protein
VLADQPALVHLLAQVGEIARREIDLARGQSIVKLLLAWRHSFDDHLRRHRSEVRHQAWKKQPLANIGHCHPERTRFLFVPERGALHRRSKNLQSRSHRRHQRVSEWRGYHAALLAHEQGIPVHLTQACQAAANGWLRQAQL